MYLDQSSVIVWSTKSHDRKRSNKRILSKDYNFPLSYMKDMAHNGHNSFAIGMCVDLFFLNNI